MEPGIGKYRKVFGVGPSGALISILLLALALLVDRSLGHPRIAENPMPLRYAACALFFLGLCLHIWTMAMLRNWWQKDRLCTRGPFKYLRHPMYAAWVTLVSLGLALVLNSWVVIAWAVLLHPIWHRWVMEEEKMMEALFGDQYRRYASHTGRFVPRLFRSSLPPEER